MDTNETEIKQHLLNNKMIIVNKNIGAVLHTAEQFCTFTFDNKSCFKYISVSCLASEMKPAVSYGF